MALQRSLLMTVLAGLLSATAAFAADKPAAGSEFVAYAQPVIAFTHATIVDGSGGKAKKDQTLLIEKGRIVALDKASRVKIPDGATLIDAKGKTLLPGFVMVHEHMFYPAGGVEYNEMSYSFPRL